MWVYYASVVILALMLLWPVSNLIRGLSVRRLERRLGRTLDMQELRGQRNRALFIGLFLCLFFSALFNLRLFV